MAIAPISLADIAAGIGGFVILGEDYHDNSAFSVASAGDINGDGFDDLIIGAEAADGAVNAKDYAGGSYVVFGKAGDFGTSIDLAAVAAGTGGFVIHGQDVNDRSGLSVATAGDINGDGYDDLIIGALLGDAADNAKTDAGDSYVVFGKASSFGSSIDLVDVAEGSGGFVIHGQDAGDYCGLCVASAGDINGDGFDDVIIGAPHADGAGNVESKAGDSYVIFGKASGFSASIDLVDVAAGTGGFVIHGQDAFDAFGRSVASAGDINGDGFDDLIIGAYGGDGAGNSKIDAGDSYVVFGKASGFGASIDLAAVAAGTGGFVLYGVSSDHSGKSLASAGDINGDGFDDLVISATGESVLGNAKADGGDVYVVFGKAGSFGATVNLSTIADGTRGFVIHGEDARDYAGWSVASAGDINGDGFDDIVIGAIGGDGAGNAVENAGDCYVVFGTASGFGASVELSAVAAGTGGFVIHGFDYYDQSGTCVASAGDINGDGFDDLIIGTPDSVIPGDTRPGAGASYVLYGKDFTGTVTHTGTTAADAMSGTARADIMVAGLGNDTVNGAAGADAINGGAGDDRLTGGPGVDRIDGGNGLDTANYASSAAAVSVNLATDINTGGDATGDHLHAIENLVGSALGDTLTGNQGANVLDGDTGNDTLVGGTGNDIYVIDVATDIVTELLHSGTDTIKSSVSYNLTDTDGAGANGGNVENLTLLGTAAINGTGNALNNLITGNTATNVLNGGLGSDTLIGGAGNDVYVINVATDSVTELLNAGTDTIQSSVTYNLTDTDGAAGANGGNVDNLTLFGTAVINGTGNALNNRIIGNDAGNTLGGGAGNDTLNGGLGADKLTGGAGNDIYVVNVATDIVTELLNAGIDTIQSSVSRNLSDTDGAGVNGGNVENLTLLGTAAINGTGNGLNNVLTGNAGNNIFNGGLGNDTINGGGGNDSLTGGAGNDRLIGGVGVDAFVFGSALSAGINVDTITDFAHNIDKLQLDDDIFLQLHASVAVTSGQLFVSGTATAAHDADDRLIYNTTTGALYYDADGNGTASTAIKFAVLSTHPTLSVGDFVVIG